MASSPKPYVKARNLIPEYEVFECDTSYAITYNPCDKIQHFRAHDRLTLCTAEVLEKVFFSMHTFEIVLYPEISKKGRIHYHGYITVFDKDAFYCHNIHHLMTHGTCVIKAISDKAVWFKYIMKQATFHKYFSQMTLYKIPLTKGEKLTRNDIIVKGSKFTIDVSSDEFFD